MPLQILSAGRSIFYVKPLAKTASILKKYKSLN